MREDHNILVRAYLVNNLFIEQNYYFGKTRNIDLIMDTWRGFGYNPDKTTKFLEIHDLTDEFNTFVDKTE